MTFREWWNRISGKRSPRWPDDFATWNDHTLAWRWPVLYITRECLPLWTPPRWYRAVYQDFDRDITIFAWEPFVPLVWLARFWAMNRWCLERVLVRRVFDLPEGETYASCRFRPLRRWSLHRTDDRTGTIRGLYLARPFIFWPDRP